MQLPTLDDNHGSAGQVKTKSDMPVRHYLEGSHRYSIQYLAVGRKEHFACA